MYYSDRYTPLPNCSLSFVCVSLRSGGVTRCPIGGKRHILPNAAASPHLAPTRASLRLRVHTVARLQSLTRSPWTLTPPTSPQTTPRTKRRRPPMSWPRLDAEGALSRALRVPRRCVEYDSADSLACRAAAPPVSRQSKDDSSPPSTGGSGGWNRVKSEGTLCLPWQRVWTEDRWAQCSRACCRRSGWL